MIRFIIKAIFYIFLLLLVAGYFNQYHQLLDSISHFRVQIALAVALFSLILIFLYKNRKRYFFTAFSLFMMGYIYYITLPYFYQKTPGVKYKHLQFNLSFENKKIDSFLNFLKKEKPDIITLQEVTNTHKNGLLSLKKEYPHQRYCKFYPIAGGVAILSKYPFTKDYLCIDGSGILIQNLQIEDKIISVASIHLVWPYPYPQYQQVNNFLPYLKKMSNYKIISGDFNAATWSYVVQKIAKYSDTKVTGGLRWTFELKKFPLIPLLKLPIDQLLVSKNITVINIKTLKHFGSDHYPLLTIFKLLP